MKSGLCFGFLFSFVIVASSTDDLELFSECDRTVAKGVAVCVQYFSPLQFVSDIFTGNKDSLCCMHFKHDTCIRGVRDTVRVAKASNICPDTFSDDIISTLTDSPINEYIISSCRSFNTAKCIVDSVGDVVKTIRGIFVPNNNQPPVIKGVIDGLFNTNTNRDSGLENSFREVVNKPSTDGPVENIYNRQYIPSSSVLNPVKQLFNGEKKTPETESPLIKSLFDGLLKPGTTEAPTVLDSLSNIFNTGGNGSKGKSFLDSIGDILKANESDSSIIKPLTGAIF